MAPDPLTLPVGALLRPTPKLAPEDSIEAAAACLREHGISLVPIAENGLFVGVLTEHDLARSLAAGLEPCESVSLAMSHGKIVAPYLSGGEALELIEVSQSPALVVVDDTRRVLGILNPSDLIPRRRPNLRPPTIGGMATPFGVYLTTGTVNGGVAQWALVFTGLVMGLLWMVSAIVTNFVANRYLTHAPDWLAGDAMLVMLVGIFMIGMRLIPLSGIHAAEHQTVHAIERGEDLSLEIVRRMSRVHPRCGTNLAAGAYLFMGIVSAAPPADAAIYAGGAFVATLLFWRRIGSVLQYYVTTRPATDRQLELGIAAGKDLLEKYSRSRVTAPSIPQRLWNSGLFHVMAGASLCYGLVRLLEMVLHVDLGVSF
jgi:CBS domain-containing protein